MVRQGLEEKELQGTICPQLISLCGEVISPEQPHQEWKGGGWTLQDCPWSEGMCGQPETWPERDGVGSQR